MDQRGSTMLIVKPLIENNVADQISSAVNGRDKIIGDTLYPVRSNDSSASSSVRSGTGSTVGSTKTDAIKHVKPNNPASNPVCKNCFTTTTPLWRRDEHGAVLCNACGLFLKLHGRPRPISLKTDVIKSRNRKPTHQENPNEKKRKDSVNTTPTGSAKKRKNSSTPNSQPKKEQGQLKGSTVVEWSNQSTESNDGVKLRSVTTKSDVGLTNLLPHLSNILSNSGTDQLLSDYPIPGSPQLGNLQRQPAPQLATINEILANNKPRATQLAGINQSNLTSPSDGGKTMTTVINVNGSSHQPQLGSISNILNCNQPQKPNQSPAPVPPPPLLNQQHLFSQSLTRQQETKVSHFSTSPPPLELQQTAIHSRSSSFSNIHHSQQEFNNRKGNLSYPVCELIRPINADASSLSKLEENPPLSVVLQSQEEVIKLHTRISELELVTDLYKRHVLELDMKCKSLEQELSAAKRQLQLSQK